MATGASPASTGATAFACGLALVVERHVCVTLRTAGVVPRRATVPQQDDSPSVLTSGSAG